MRDRASNKAVWMMGALGRSFVLHRLPEVGDDDPLGHRRAVHGNWNYTIDAQSDVA